MMRFDQPYEEWMHRQVSEEGNHRRRELLEKGLGHGTVEFLRSIWFPVVGGIEIQGYGPHARDLDTARFKDLCRRHCLLALDGWVFLPIAYLSIKDEPQQCQQLVLSFIGKFISTHVPSRLTWLEAETIRLARRLLRPFTPLELAGHLRISDRHARRILHEMVDMHLPSVASGTERARTYKLKL